MIILSRRSVLAGLTLVPALVKSIAKSSEGQTAKTCAARNFYVYLHGAFILDVQKGGCFLAAPRVLESSKSSNLVHEYRVGRGPKGEGDAVSGPSHLLTLEGFKGAGTNYPKIDKSWIPRLDKLDPNNATGQYLASLKTPANITPCRQVDKSNSGDPFFSSPTELQALEKLPLLLRLDYKLEAGESPYLVGANWSDDCSDPLVLHFRAEPGQKNMQDHDALGAMKQVLKLSKLAVNSCYEDAYACYKTVDEKSLIEIRDSSLAPCTPVAPCAKGKVHGKGHRPANCLTVVVNNTGQPLE